ncbi:hypothetical protein CRG98_043137 [Punica granatum]|uniref:Uncharacterized protein n=1 Tax=Punica granatum TaxID=22663 RepID=A0A2I0HXP3_PUNGR|nr:hypothetical protein CRG98_043137 [Punica granatum]
MTNDTSERVSGAYHLSRDTPDLSRTPFLTGFPGSDPLTSKRHPKMGLQAPRDHWGHGTSFRRPLKTLRGFPRNVSVVATASRHSGNTEKAPVTSPQVFPRQRSSVEDDEPTIPHEAKGSPKQTLRCTKGNRRPGTLNSTPNVRTGQNRLSRRRVARTFAHATNGDIRLIQILFVQAFQIYKLIGHRRSNARSIKSQAFFGFSLNRMGLTAQPSHGSISKPLLKPKIRWLQAPRSSPLHTFQIPSYTYHFPSLPHHFPSLLPYFPYTLSDTNPSLTLLQKFGSPIIPLKITLNFTNFASLAFLYKPLGSLT